MHLGARWRWFRNELKKTDSRMWFLIFVLSVFLLFLAFGLLVTAGSYLNERFRESDQLKGIMPLHDFVLDFLPVVNLMFLIRIGIFVSVVLILIGMLNEPYRMDFCILIIVFWILIRTAFMVVTPMAPPKGIIPELPSDFAAQSIWDYIRGGLASPHTLFFSGHVGLAFLGHLLFKRSIKVGTLIWPLILTTIFYFASGPSYSFWLIVILGLFWFLILRNKNRLISLSFVFLLWSFVMAASVLLTRNHYSVDVLGAYFITPGILSIGRWCFHKVELLCEKMESAFPDKEK